MKTDVHNEKTTAVLVVHGIGAQNESDTLRKLLDGLRRAGCEADDERAPGGCVWCGRHLRFYEVYWADICKGEQARGSFEIMRTLSLAWYPMLNWLRGNYREADIPLSRKLFWVLVMPVVHLLLIATYWGASLLVQVYRGLREGGSRVREKKLALKDQPANAANASVWSRLRELATAPPPENHLDVFLDEFAGDVLSYVSSAGKVVLDTDSRASSRGCGAPKELAQVHERVMDRFHSQLLRACREGCDDIHVLAHSLGTVVAYHALTGLNGHPGAGERREEIVQATSRVRHLHTLGSPLEKIRFFWPGLMPGNPPLGGACPLWDNHVSWFDPVAGMLGRFQGFQPVRNHRLLGGGMLRAHVVYEHSDVFLKSLAESMDVTPSLRPASIGERWKERCLLLGETLLGPLAVLVLLVAGACVALLVVHLIPWLVSLVARLFFEPQQWQPWVDMLARIMMWMFGAAFVLGSFATALTEHRRFWGPEKRGTPGPVSSQPRQS